MVKVLVKLSVCLSGLLRTHLSLKRLVVFLNIHFMTHVCFMLDLIMFLFGVVCVTPLTITLAHVLICMLCSF